MTDTPEKLNLKSVSITDDQKAKLKQLFPEVFNEDRIDYDKLKRTLGEEIDTGEERFGMTWPGKNDCFKVIQTPSIGTLKPAKEESVNWDTTENLFIEGDNLEILKLLQGAYYGKIKMIYIDPPYNTGKDFIYPDNYTESLDTYLAYTGQTDEEGKKFTTNPESSGRFHSKWLNMMYPRLFLARNLLKPDGIIFISIDENEVHNLRMVMNEIFGEESFIAQIANVNNPKGRSDDKYIATAHEYVLIYKKHEAQLGGWEPGENVTKRYRLQDETGDYREIDLRKTGDNDLREDRPNLFYYFYYNQTTKDFYPSKTDICAEGYIQIKPTREDGREGNWRWELDSAKESMNLLVPKFMPQRKKWTVVEKDYIRKNEKIKPTSVWSQKEFNSERGTEQFVELGFDKRLFPRPKPVGGLQQIIKIGVNQEKNDIVLDFFAGSCTAAHAVMQLNAEDGGNRKFVCVQLPEACEVESEAYKAGFKTIADIGKERIRRVIKKIQEEQAAKKKDAEGKLSGMAEEKAELDLGFRVFKLDKSNFNIWDGTVDESGDTSRQIEMFIDHIDPNASDEGILCEILLKTRFPLTTKIEELNIAGKKVYSVADKALLICLDRKLTKEVITEMARLQPARIVCLDVGFADNDQLKTNAVQIMKSHGVEDFRTV